MIEVLYRYRVHPQQVRAFEHAYGANGPWVALFRRDRGFRRTRLFRHKTEAQIYVTVDVWDSKEAYDRFRSVYTDDYNRLDTQLTLLKLEEHFLGCYEGPDEYRARLDTMA